MTSDARVKVLYIVGYGRSGSTILDMVVSQLPGTFGAGEVTALSRHVWTEDEYCACGERIRSCPLWRAIMARWADGEAPDFLDRYHALQRRYELLAGPFLPVRSRNFAEYRRQTVRLFRAIAAETGCPVVLDSSKLPGRAWGLLQMPEIELFVLHLVRDARGVAWSMHHAYDIDLRAGLQKTIRPKSVVRTALRWTAVNALAERAGAGASSTTRVAYEDFVSAPDATLRAIGEWVGTPWEEVAAAVRNGAPIHNGHQMAGSRIRMKPSVVVTRDVAWRTQMPPDLQARVSRITGWMLRRYGFT